MLGMTFRCQKLWNYHTWEVFIFDMLWDFLCALYVKLPKYRNLCLFRNNVWWAYYRLCQKTGSMGVVVFGKMWVKVILDIQKQFPESVLWTILKHYWNEFQQFKNILTIPLGYEMERYPSKWFEWDGIRTFSMKQSSKLGHRTTKGRASP